MKKAIRYLPSAVFCAAIFVIGIMFLLGGQKDYSPLEKRKLAQFPEVSAESVFDGSFGRDFESYLNDQMPLRNFFVGVNSYYDKLCGRNGSNGIYSGKDGYLFTAPLDRTDMMNNNLKFIGEFIDDTGFDCTVCVIPSSGYVNSEKLPTVHPDYKDNELIAAIESEITSHPNARFVNITDEFVQLADDEQLYYRTDHHWTSQGAYECCKMLAEPLGYTAAGKDSFEIEQYQGFYGTNYAKSGLWFTPSETLEIWNRKNRTPGSIKVVFSENGEEKAYDGMFFRDNLDSQDMYTAFLDGNHGCVTITNSSVDNGKSLLVLRDSYTHCLAPFLADYYSKIVLIDLRYYVMSVSELARNEGIDDVLFLYSLDSMVSTPDPAGVY